MVNPTSVTLRRWRSLFLCGCISGAIVLLAYPYVLAPIARTLRPYGYVPSITLAIVITVYLARSGVRPAIQTLGARHPWAYPPTWFAAVLGSLGLLIAVSASTHVQRLLDVEPTPRRMLALATGMLVCSALVVGGTLLAYRRAEGESATHTNETNTASRSPLTTSTSELLAWLSNDRELASPSLDAFGHAVVARRIATRIATPADDNVDSRTAVLIGPRGSGKSTIAAFVQTYLETPSARNHHIEFISISLWPYDTPEAAVRAVLERLVLAASKHVDPVTLRGMPQAYVSLIESAGGWLQGFAKGLAEPTTPDRVLQDLSAALAAVRVDIVLWIDDLDRFADRGEDSAARLAPIRSLIYLLDRSPRLRVILASTSLRDGFDLDKIARFVERPPQLQPLYVWRILRCFRNHCLAGRGRDYLDFADTTMALSPPDDDASLSLWLFNWLSDVPTPQRALADILTTPRLLKDALRDCLARWSVLKGEVDFDELLAMSAVRAAREPDVFMYICENVDMFRRDWSNSPTNGDDKAAHTQKERFIALVATVGSTREHTALHALIGFAFATWDHHSFRLHPGPRPQSISAEPYWSRYLSVSINPSAPPDQPTLAAIEAWRSGGPNDLVARMLDPMLVQHVEHYGFRFDRRELLRLLSETVASLIPLPPTAWGDRHPPAIVALARLMRQRTPSRTDLVDCLSSLIRAAVRRNLPLTNAIVSWLVHWAPSSPGVVDPQDEAQLVALSRTELATWFGSSDPGLLRAALQGGHPSTCWTLCFGFEGYTLGSAYPPPFAEWLLFSNALLAAAGTYTADVMPQLLIFVVEQAHRHALDEDLQSSTNSVLTFSFERARAWFDFHALSYVIMAADPDASWDPQMSAYLAEAKDALRSMPAVP